MQRTTLYPRPEVPSQDQGPLHISATTRAMGIPRCQQPPGDTGLALPGNQVQCGTSDHQQAGVQISLWIKRPIPSCPQEMSDPHRTQPHLPGTWDLLTSKETYSSLSTVLGHSLSITSSTTHILPSQHQSIASCSDSSSDSHRLLSGPLYLFTKSRQALSCQGAHRHRGRPPTAPDAEGCLERRGGEVEGRQWAKEEMRK